MLQAIVLQKIELHQLSQAFTLSLVYMDHLLQDSLQETLVAEDQMETWAALESPFRRNTAKPVLPCFADSEIFSNF